MNKIINNPDLFWQRVAVSASDQCWPWQRTVTKAGYGVFGHNRKLIYAHRYALFLHTHEMPSHLSAIHSCDNPPCCNPHHLRWGTHAENMRDIVLKRRGNHGERNGRAKLLPHQILAIRNDARRLREIATEYGVSETQIWRIRHGMRWTTQPELVAGNQ